MFVAGDKSRDLAGELLACLASVLEYIDPLGMCKVVLNRAFRGASYADFVLAALISIAGK